MYFLYNIRIFISQMKMKRILTFIIILCIIKASKLEKRSSQSQQLELIDNSQIREQHLVKHDLTFSNITGKGVTPQQISFFKQIANYASLIYGDDIQTMMKLLKYRMDKAYGSQHLNFYVFLQTEERANNHLIQVDNSGVYAGLQGINKIQPNWSYFFAKNLGYNRIEDYNLIKKDQKGVGITQTFKIQLKNIINRYEISQTCTCSKQSINDIQKAISQYSSQPYSILCDDGGVTNSLIMSFQQQWISLKAKTCYYSIYR